MSKYAEIHLHSLDQFDSQNDPDRVCAKLASMGAKGLCLTQHGVLSGIEPMRMAAQKYNLKFVPGIETYYRNTGDLMKNQHLILLSMDDIGYKAISMAVSDSQNDTGFSVMSDEILNQYFGPGGFGHGHVIATTACIQGPLGVILRQNETVDKEIAKLSNRFKNASDVSGRIKSTQDRLKTLGEDLADTKSKRDAAKKLADSKFAAREKRLKKLSKSNDPRYEQEKDALEADKQKAEKAKKDFEILKSNVTRMLRKQSIMSKELKELMEQQARHEEYVKAVEAMQAKKISDEEAGEQLMAEARNLSGIFGPGCLYVEMQYHGIDDEARIYPRLAKLAHEAGLPLIASNDVHIVENTEEERLRRQILRSLRFGDGWEEENVGDSELYIKTDEELREWLLKILTPEDVQEAMENIRVVFDQCNVQFKTGKHYPKFPVPDGITANQKLEEEARKGIRKRFPGGLTKVHKERLSHEMKTIEGMGYADYFLIVKDFLEYARILAPVPEERLQEAPLTIEGAKAWVKANGWKGGISVGPGRGSAAGSDVSYVLGITNLDPVKYGLLFERFLNPERVSMPDIDCDIAKAVRPMAIRYVQNKYGQNAVCGILTMNAQAPRGAIRIAAKFYGFRTMDDGKAFLSLGDALAKRVPNEPGVSFAQKNDEGITLFDQLMSENASDACAQEILKMAKVVEGCFTTYGAHAAGIVISDNTDVKEYVPLRWNKKLNEWTTQCDM